MKPTYQFKLNILNNRKPETIDLELDQVLRLVQNPEKFTVIMMTNPVCLGNLALMSAVEYILYPPTDEKLNALFTFFSADFGELHFDIMTVPRKDYALIRHMAAMCGVQLKHRYKLSSFIGGRVVDFPINGKSVFYTTNTDGHPVERMTHKEIMTAVKVEVAFADQFTARKEFLLDLQHYVSYQNPKALPKNTIKL